MAVIKAQKTPTVAAGPDKKLQVCLKLTVKFHPLLCLISHPLREISVCTYNKTKLKTICRGRTGFCEQAVTKGTRDWTTPVSMDGLNHCEFSLAETSGTVVWKHRKMHLLASVTSIFSGLFSHPYQRSPCRRTEQIIQTVCSETHVTGL